MIPLTIMKELPSLANRRLRARGRPGEASPRAARESRRILWFVDNTVAMHSFIKGRASHAALDRAISMAKFLQAGHESGWRRASAPPLTQGHARVGIWMEFVDSGGNWSDGISRELGEDVFAREQGFHTASMEASQRVARKRRGGRGRTGTRCPRSCGRGRLQRRGTQPGPWLPRPVSRRRAARRRWPLSLAAHEL